MTGITVERQQPERSVGSDHRLDDPVWEAERLQLRSPSVTPGVVGLFVDPDEPEEHFAARVLRLGVNPW